MTCRLLRALGLSALVLSAGIANAQSPDTTHYRCPGIGIVHNNRADVCLTLWTYMRYLNQRGLRDSFTDSFGRTSAIHRRQDIQNNKLNFGIRGSIFSPKFRFTGFVWTANTSQGDVNQVAVGAFLFYDFNRYLTIAGGAGSLPSTRSTQGTFPNWLRVDNRTMADEFFRGSYTAAGWITGEAAPGLKYMAMLGNNLSGYGINAQQLDAVLNTYSVASWWMPTTKEYGPIEGFGDFEHHDRLATLVGLHFTGSREDRESQPDPDAIENVQLRLSDGTNIFSVGAFAPGTRINRANYHMLAAEAGAKYRGAALEGEYYSRWLDKFTTEGTVPVTSLFDQGFQLQASQMILPKRLQGYLSGSKIYGQYGDPWDLAAGLNWFPYRERHFRLNAQGLRIERSPVGYAALPYPLGARGFIFTFDVELFF